MTHDTRPSHRRARIILTASMTLILAILSTQCRPVADNVMGVKLESSMFSNATNCISQCAMAYGDSMNVESSLHVTNVQSCAGDSACLAVETIRFNQVVARIQTGRMECMNACHHQGGGQGGR
jgi:hypothetical protein